MSMKTFKTLLWSLLCLTFVVSCGDDPVDQPGNGGGLPNVTKDSVVKLAKKTVTASLAGGPYSISYEIQNPHPATQIEVTPAESWVKDIDLSTPELIQFVVEPNEGTTSRSCLVTVTYRFANPVVFTVSQNAKVNSGFSIENVRPSYFDYTVDIIPEDKKTPYIVMSADPIYIIQSDFKTGEDFYNDDLAYFQWLGQFYNMSAVEVMQSRVKSGDQTDVVVKGATPGVPYTFYCYYVDYASGALLSEVEMFTVTTATPVLKDVEFDFDYEIVDGCMVSADVVPVGYEGDYYFDVRQDFIVEDYLTNFVDFYGNPILKNEADYFQYWWSTAVVDLMSEMSAEQILAEFTCVGWNDDEKTQPRSHFDFELLAETTYYLFAYTMEENALCSSVPKFVKITTGDVAMSDNVIELECKNITARTATFEITPSNDDYYVVGWAKAADWASFGNTDLKRMNYLLKNTSYELDKGALSINVLNLESDTEYVLYAFGSRGGKPTTEQLFSTTFKTKSGAAGNVQISFKDLGYYDASDFANFEGYEYLANYAGMAILPLEVEFSSEEHGLWFSEIYDWTGRTDVYDEKQWMDHLVWAINEYGGLTATHTYTMLEFGKRYQLGAVVLDTEGLFSGLYIQWIEPVYDGVGAAQDYVTWWNAYQATLPEIEIPSDDENTDGEEPINPEEPVIPEEGDEQDPVEGDGEVVPQSLVIDNNNNTLFKAKIQASKVSNMNIEAKQVVPAVDEILAR